MNTERIGDYEVTTDGKETWSVKRNLVREAEEIENAMLRKQVQDFNAAVKLVLFTVVSVCIFALVLQIVLGA